MSLGVELLGHKIGIYLIFKEIAKSFQKQCVILHSQQQHMKVQVLHPHQPFVFLS